MEALSAIERIVRDLLFFIVAMSVDPGCASHHHLADA